MGKLSEYLARHREKAEHGKTKITETVLVAAGAGAAGYLNGRATADPANTAAGPVARIFRKADGSGGLPLDVTIGGTALLLSFVPQLGRDKTRDMLADVGDGFLAGFAYRSGFAYSQAHPAGASAQGTLSGYSHHEMYPGGGYYGDGPYHASVGAYANQWAGGYG